MNLRYFDPSEFERCTPKCLIGQMDSDFLQLLDGARHIAGIPFILNSAYRSPEWELTRSPKRSGRGYHTLGRAVDVRCTDSRSRYKIVSACTQVGLSCGLSKDGFIHIDNRPSPCIFLY